MFERPALPADRFPSPFANSKAAAAANSGAVPPDLSLITKARNGGADYIHAFLTGYTDPPDGMELIDVQSYNLYFPGNVTAMAPPLFEDAVEYADGTPATAEQMATDVSTFLTWAAEPEMEERKRMGIKVILFLLVLTGILYAVKRKVWADLH
jgi:cytochrome c1